MKTHTQRWQSVPDKWTTVIGRYYRKDGTMLLGNYIQKGVLHYVEDEFLTDDIIAKVVKEVEKKAEELSKN